MTLEKQYAYISLAKKRAQQQQQSRERAVTKRQLQLEIAENLEKSVAVGREKQQKKKQRLKAAKSIIPILDTNKFHNNMTWKELTKQAQYWKHVHNHTIQLTSHGKHFPKEKVVQKLKVAIEQHRKNIQN